MDINQVENKKYMTVRKALSSLQKQMVGSYDHIRNASCEADSKDVFVID